MDAYPGSYQNGNFKDADFQLQKLTRSIGTNIQKILQNNSSIQRMIAQIGTPQDNQQLQNQLHHIQHYTGQLAKETSGQLQELNTLLGGNFGAEQRQWRQQRERLHADFTKALNTFQAAQRTVATKEKEIVKKAKAAGYSAAQEQDSQNLIDVESGAGSGQKRTQLLLEEEQRVEELAERERAIRQLESDIVDVNTIFKDLATMVHDQGEMIDSIESAVESSHIRVHDGAEELRHAERYKNKARKKKFILFLILLIVLAIIIGIVAWQSN